MTIRFAYVVTTCVLLGAILNTNSASASKFKLPDQGCAVREVASWNPNIAGRRGPTLRPLRIEAVSSGPRCSTARVVLTIKNQAGTILHRDTYRADQVMGLSNARTPAQMRNELRTWISVRGTETYHADLPNWRRGQSEPDAREFPFMPADGVTRARYLAIKANRTPIYCYVQGIESLNCLVLQNGALRPFGIQSFPG